ncbi:MAG TPA: restriction endonuclease, partial [Archangium sp.]|nr:restriction endonuclease [Archangium sp.]
MTPEIPRPKEWTELEHLVLRLARDLLKDPHASYYGTQGHEQHGLDVMAEDRRPDGTGKRWVFQAKNYLKTKLQPRHLKKLKDLLLKYSHRESIDTFVVVTTSTVSPAVHDEAKELSERLRLTFKVWSWEVFSEHLRTHCGAGPWLSQTERVALRERYGRWAADELRQAGPLYPLNLVTVGATGVRLEEVLIARTLRGLPHPGEAHARQAAGGPAGAREEATTPQPTTGESPTSSAAPRRFEGTLVQWLEPRDATGKPLVLMLAPMGTGKTVALLQTEAQLAAAARAGLEAPLPLRLRAVELVGGLTVELLRRKGLPDLGRLWDDPLCQWVLLVDGLDEVEGQAQPEVLRHLSALHEARNVVGLAVSCRTSHDNPRLLSEAQRVELPSWSDDEAQAFLRRWEQMPQGGGLHEEVRALLASDSSLRSNALCTTLLLLRAPKREGAREGRAWLFQPLVDDLFRQWAEARGPSGRDNSGWGELQRSFEEMALRGLEQGGFPLPRRVLETALARALGDDTPVAKALDAACRLGLVRLTEGGTWDMPLRAIAEYLAAGALRRVGDDDFTCTSGQPWAAEVARLALQRSWHLNPT